MKSLFIKYPDLIRNVEDKSLADSVYVHAASHHCCWTHFCVSIESRARHTVLSGFCWHHELWCETRASRQVMWLLSVFIETQQTLHLQSSVMIHIEYYEETADDSRLFSKPHYKNWLYYSGLLSCFPVQILSDAFTEYAKLSRLVC